MHDPIREHVLENIEMNIIRYLHLIVNESRSAKWVRDKCECEKRNVELQKALNLNASDICSGNSKNFIKPLCDRVMFGDLRERFLKMKRKKCFNKALKTVLNEAESRMHHSIDTHERDEEMRPGHPNEGKVPSELCGEDCWCREEMHPVYNSEPWDEDSRREFKYDAQEFIEMELNRYIGIAQSGESCICGEHSFVPTYHRAK